MSAVSALLHACSCRTGLSHLASLFGLWVGVPVLVFSTVVLGLRRRQDLRQGGRRNQVAPSGSSTPAEAAGANGAIEAKQECRPTFDAGLLGTHPGDYDDL